ncbi:hypothetical protein B0H34DRAFT_684514 [Crassisporium funariophilum]|nr:hypothetical protein B0H34DRAFT_684514 [Crassisporium funariophilum]
MKKSKASRSGAFPFVDGEINYLHRSIVTKIQQEDYLFELPSLNEISWRTILNNAAERERLEFVGDALIGAAVAEELYRAKPDGSPGFYTKARSVLTANSTFAHLMHKAGLFPNMNHPIKPAGDALETILACYQSEHGSQAFQSYTRQQFLPLILVVAGAYDRYRMDAHLLRKRKRKQPGVGTNLPQVIRSFESPRTRQKVKKQLAGHVKARCHRIRKTMTTSLPPTSPEGRGNRHMDTSFLDVEIVEISASAFCQAKQSTSSRNIRFDASHASSTRFHDETSVQSQLAGGHLAPHYTYRESIPDDDGSSTETRDLLRSISVSSKLTKPRRSNPPNNHPQVPVPVPIPSHVVPPQHSDDLTQDDLVKQFQQTSLLGSVQNPITID